MSGGNAYKNSVDGLCQRVLARLGEDVDDPTWDRDQVSTSVADALQLMSILRPQLFTVAQPIELQPGSCVQQLPKDCPTVTEYTCVVVDGESTPVVMASYDQVKQTSIHPPSRRRKISGRSNMIANAIRVGVSDSDARNIAVSPMPVTGIKMVLWALCVDACRYTENDDLVFDKHLIPFIPAMSELALYLLLSTDRETPEIAAQAAVALQAFQSLTDISLAGVQGNVRQLLRARQEQQIRG